MSHEMEIKSLDIGKNEFLSKRSETAFLFEFKTPRVFICVSSPAFSIIRLDEEVGVSYRAFAMTIIRLLDGVERSEMSCSSSWASRNRVYKYTFFNTSVE